MKDTNIKEIVENLIETFLNAGKLSLELRDKGLTKKIISLNNLNLLVNKKEFDEGIFVKVRSTGKLLDAKIDFKDHDKANVNLKISEDGISPGQACVFYKKDMLGYKVLGGGWISN